MSFINGPQQSYKAPWCETGAALEGTMICASQGGSTEDFTGDFPEYNW
ncbi:MAG: hypothetical protein II809_04075 [Bacteroidales bacterium]|nr:hypothetical protein [Bacteroidales bacterium]MBQ6556901.1 hypothetical protein [Bacteroidales bacterium]MBQ6822417.1 hypothetical protein [Bacteroidales bacterium]MBR0084377.1 hypothetical protein [Bacteroidales bacterium]